MNWKDPKNVLLNTICREGSFLAVTVTLQELRRQLRDKFPQAHAVPNLPESGQPTLQKPFQIETFPIGAVSEIICSAQTSVLGLWIAGLLGEPEDAAPLPEFVLVDGGDHFDPASYTDTACSRLLWVRCSHIRDALKATDMLVRDGNVPFVMLDLHSMSLPSLRSISSSIWWRLKQCCETSACRLVVMAPFPLVPCASLRLSLSASLVLDDFTLPRREVLQKITATAGQLRHAH